MTDDCIYSMIVQRIPFYIQNTSWRSRRIRINEFILQGALTRNFYKEFVVGLMHYHRQFILEKKKV